jgi:hypothetical protein
MTKATDLVCELVQVEMEHDEAVSYLDVALTKGAITVPELVERAEEAILEEVTESEPEPEPEPEVVVEEVDEEMVLFSEAQGLLFEVLGTNVYRRYIADRPSLSAMMEKLAKLDLHTRLAYKFKALEARYLALVGEPEPTPEQVEAEAQHWVETAAIQHALEHQHKLVNGVDMPRGWKADQYKTSYWRSKEWLEELHHTTRCVSVDNRAIVWPNSEATDVAKEEPMEQHSTLDLVREFGTDTNLYQGHTVDELKAYCRELGLKGYSSKNKAALVRELATLAGLELQMFAGAETVTPDEQEADEAREAAIQALEAEKDAQPAPPEPKFAEADIENAKRQIAIWAKKPRSPRTILALDGWRLKLKIMQLVNEGKDASKLVALYREKAAQFKALDTKPEAVPAPTPKAKNLTLGEHLAQALEAKGIPYELDGDVIRWKGGIVTLANHVLGFTRTFMAWCTPEKWVGCNLSEVVKVRK